MVHYITSQCRHVIINHKPKRSGYYSKESIIESTASHDSDNALIEDEGPVSPIININANNYIDPTIRVQPTIIGTGAYSSNNGELIFSTPSKNKDTDSVVWGMTQVSKILMSANIPEEHQCPLINNYEQPDKRSSYCLTMPNFKSSNWVKIDLMISDILTHKCILNETYKFLVSLDNNGITEISPPFHLLSFTDTNSSIIEKLEDGEIILSVNKDDVFNNKAFCIEIYNSTVKEVFVFANIEMQSMSN